MYIVYYVFYRMKAINNAVKVIPLFQHNKATINMHAYFNPMPNLELVCKQSTGFEMHGPSWNCVVTLKFNTPTH